MILRASLLFLLMACAIALPATAARPGLADPVATTRAVDRTCLLNPKRCKAMAHRLSFPAHALSYGHAGFALHVRGIDWPGNQGKMSLTIRRPLDYTGGPVKLSILHEIVSDAGGSLQFLVTPVTLRHGASFETYGSVGSTLAAVSESPQTLQVHAITIPPGNGFSPTGEWWYLEIGRQGSFDGKLRVLSVAIDY